MLPLVAQHEIDVAQRQRGQRLLGLGLDELAAQARRVARQRPHRRHGEIQRHRLERGDATAARHDAGGRGQVGLRERGALEQRIGVTDQHERRVGQTDAAARALKQAHTGLALEHRELLGDGRGRELQRVGDRGDRPALLELVQQAQAAEVEHQAMLLSDTSAIRIASDAFVGQDGPMRFGALVCLASAVAFGAMGIFGKLAYEQGATVGTLLAVRFVLAATVLFWGLALATGAVADLRTLSRRDLGLALALGAVGYSAQAGAYFAALERLDASLLSLLVYTFPAMVTVAAIALGRERASRRTAGALVLASAGLVLVLAGAGAGALDPLGTLLGTRGRGRLQHLHPHLRGRRRARRPAAPERAGVHRRGDDADARRGRRRRPAPGRRERDRVRLAGGHRGRLDGRGGRPVLRRPAARRPDDRLDPLDGRAGDHRRAGLPGLRRVARSRAARRRGAACSVPCSS